MTPRRTETRRRRQRECETYSGKLLKTNGFNVLLDHDYSSSVSHNDIARKLYEEYGSCLPTKVLHPDGNNRHSNLTRSKSYARRSRSFSKEGM